MYYQLGNITFSGSYGPGGITSQHSARYSSTPLAGGGTVLQKTGDELITLSFDAYLHFSFVNPSSAIESFESARKNGEILPLTDGTGQFYGNYVVTSYNVARSGTNPSGETVEATISVSLSEYIDPDAAATLRRQAIANAAAIEENGAVSSVVQALPPSDAGATIISINAANAAAIEADELIDRAIVLPSESTSILTQVSDLYNQGKAELENALEKATTVATISAQAPALVDSLDASISAFNAAGLAATSGDLSNAKSSSLNAISAIENSIDVSQGLSINIIRRRL